MSTLRAWLSLVWISFSRLLWSANTWMALAPLAACLVFLVHRRYGDGDVYSVHDFDRFSIFLMRPYLSVVLPLAMLGFASGSVGGEREDRTLVFLLVRPLARPLILLAKFAATLPLALGVAIGSLDIFCRLAGTVGPPAYTAYLPAVMLATVAYLGLFQLFAVSFRHATIVAMIYTLLVERLLGHAPGIIERVAVNYYARVLMYAAGHPDGLARPDPRWFDAISPLAAQAMLAAIAVVGLSLAAWIFQRREYRDLT